MEPISVVICCANNEDVIEAACQSAKWADQLVVVDSGSQDATGQIARRYADQYVIEPWRGFSKQKQFAAELAKNDWIFTLDSDEECSEKLIQEIYNLNDQVFAEIDLFLMPRHHFVMGKPVRAWSPDLQSRLYNRRRCTYGGEVLHDSRQASSRSRIRKLKNPILHKRVSRGGFKDYFDGKLEDSRLLMVASDMHSRGRRCHIWDLLLRPASAFIKSLIIKRGILDGTWGLVIAQKAAAGVQLKYAALWSVQKGLADGDSEKPVASRHRRDPRA